MTAQPADVVSLAGRHRADLGAIASGQVAAARAEAGLALAAFAGRLGTLLTWKPSAEAVGRWERDSTPPGDVLLACAAISQGTAGPDLPLLAAVPPAFPAEALAGPWVTTYVFSHAGRPHFHADIATIAAESESRIRAVNHPPEPRSEGRRQAFRNEIEARLIGRHLVGEWQNTSDHRYAGVLQLAVLPGEIVMQGHYAGVGSDIEVSQGFWKWVRLEPAADLAGVVLREPSGLHHLVMSHSQIDVPLTLAEILEDH
jgi:transcriptional regulator with XRE-family HTH domain